MIGIMQAVERHVETLSAGPDRQTEADFLARYRRHVREHHGMLEPPDFERRRRVPVANLYVSPAIVQDLPAEAQQVPVRQVTLEQLAGEIDRTVLLGDPGSGKTTAANVLMYWEASRGGGRVPFLVALRDLSAGSGSRQSIADHIREKLEGFYQCPAPPQSVERLLLSGVALVIFDGLDELADATRRGEVTAIIERFCTEYPLTPVLVTSRFVGYEQARLDDRQFDRYRIGGFDDQQVADYVRKWFMQEDDVTAAGAGLRAASFLAESASVPDLRANPLMLALMCVLYRGEGSIPRNRPEVYEQCSVLLLRKWDARRHIHAHLSAGSHAESATRHLAYWLFTRRQNQPVVAERELLRETTAFLRDRRFEDEFQASQAAQELIEFVRDRAWVLSEAGTTANGERLYAFTHRTFLEYFAGAHLASTCDTPEALASALAPKIARQEWDVVAEIAVQIKCAGIDRGAERTYAALLASPEGLRRRSHVLQFLARCMRFLEPPPRTVRDLARTTLDYLFSGDISEEDCYQPLSWLLACCAGGRATVRDEIAARAAAMIASPDQSAQANGLRLAVWVARGAVHHRDGLLIVPARAPEDLAEYWDDFAYENVRRYAREVTAAAAADEGMLYASLRHRFLTAADVLDRLDCDLTPLITAHQAAIFGVLWTPYLLYLIGAAARGWGRAVHSGLPRADQDTLDDDFRAVGRWILGHPSPPWASICMTARYEPVNLFNEDEAHLPGLYTPKGEDAFLGAAASLLTAAEATRDRMLPAKGDDPLGSLSSLYPYILRRWNADPAAALPDLPLPAYFQRLFRAWADNQVDFIHHTNTPHP
jgi:hypothetical protein